MPARTIPAAPGRLPGILRYTALPALLVDPINAQGPRAVVRIGRAAPDTSSVRHIMPTSPPVDLAPPVRAATRAAALALAALLLATLAACDTTARRDEAPAHPAGVAPDIAVADTHQEAAAMRVDTLDARRVDRVTGGVDATALQAVGQLGWSRWLDAQLHPQSVTWPTAVNDRLSQMRIVREPLATRLRADAAQRKAAEQIADDEQKKAALQAYQKTLNAEAEEADQRWLLFAVNSPNQVQERMVWFWANHFSIGQQKGDLRAFVGDYEEALRAHALGKFRDLLEASAFHPAMLRYLDNERNAAGQVNENYARELMELHTLGVDAGYTQGDVQEMARVLTGVGVRIDDKDARVRPQLQPLYVHAGLFEFNPARHDFGDKTLFGASVRAGGIDEVRRVLDTLARSPATARHVSTQLAQYFVADTPPPALVDRMVQRWLSSDGDIAAVLKTMFTAPEFDASLGKRFKDPWLYVVSATRLSYDGSVVLNAGPLLNGLRQLGEMPFGHETPEGWSMAEAAWASPGQMTTRFDVAKALVGGNGNGNAALFRVDGVIQLAALPKARVESPAWLRTQAPRASEATRQALVATLAQHPGDWAWAAIVSPEFMRN